jgi:C1A family cysteine protease
MKANSFVLTLSRMLFAATLLLSMFLTGSALAAAVMDSSLQLEWSFDAELPIPDSSAATDYSLQSRDSFDLLVTKLTAEGVTARLTPMRRNGSGAGYTLRASATGSIDDFRRIVYTVMKQELDLLQGTTEMTISAGAMQGHDVQLVIEAKPSTGYLWEVASDSALKVNRPSTFEMHTRGYGVPQRQILRLHAGNPGSASLKTVYRRPWESTSPTRHFTLKLSSLPDRLDLSDPTAPTGSLPKIEGSLDQAASPQLAATAPPASWDWRTQGIVTAVRDQGSCGSCWAFGTVGVMESALLKSGAGNVDLSEQFLVSCNTSNWNCDNGGWTAHMYHYDRLGKSQTVVGAVLEADKPYTATNGSCNQAYNHPYKLSAWQFITPTEFDMPTVDQIKSAIYTYGPITAGVCAGSGWDYYSGGIFATNETAGCGGSTNHQIILVGWNDNGGNGYWILKNSWGPGWGINGYMNIAYNTSRVGEGTSWVTTNPVGNLPNLAPYQPSGWSDKIVVSKTTGATTDSSPLYPTDPLYVDWAVINNGTAAITTTFRTSLYVDGILKTSWDAASLPASSYTSAQDYVIGTLSAGAHTLKIVADTAGVVGESNEGDNEYTKTITITSSGCTATPITVGQTVSGSLSTSDCRSPTRGSSYYADRYSLSASAGQQVAIVLTSSVFDAYLYLLGTSGTVIASDDDGAGGTNSRIPASSGYYTLPSAGTYIIEVTSYDANKTGNYVLSLTGFTGSAPAAATGAATAVTSSSATLNATVNPNGLATTVSFQWGSTTSYGKTTASQSIGSGTSNQNVSAALTGLSPSTIYHYRIVATNSVGTSYGSDMTFTTSAVSAKPNLTPYKPSGWSDKIVVARTTGTTTDGSNLRATDRLYLDWAVINNGSASIATAFRTSLYVDGQLRTSWSTSSLAINTYFSIKDYVLGKLGVGAHTIRIVTDSTGAISEANEGDNEYIKTITVGQ